MLRFLLIVILLLFVHSGFSQNSTLERIRQEDGLPSDIVKALAVDSQGFIWVGTDGGLAKIEGRNIIKVTDSNGATASYKDILLSKKYGMVAACDGDILKITQDYKGIYSHKLIDSSTIFDYSELIFPKSIFESGDSSLWFADSKVIIHIRGTKSTTFEFPEKNHTRNFFRSYQFMELDDHHLFILSQNGYLYSYHNAQDTMVELPWEYAGIEIYAIHKLKTNQFLIGCSRGLLQITFENGLIKKVKDLQFKYGAYVIEPQKKNQFLVGTLGNGAYQLILNDTTIKYNILPGSEGQAILDIVLDNQQQIWLGTGYGLFVYRHITYINPFKETLINGIIDLKIDQNDQLFFTDGYSVYQTNNDRALSKIYTLKQGGITAISPKNNSLWIGTNAGQIMKKQNNGTVVIHDFSNKGDEIVSLAIDKSSALWFIQKRKGKASLLRMDKAGKIKDFTPDTKEEFDLRFIKLSPSGEVYVGARGLNDYLFNYNYQTNAIDNLSLPIDSLNEPPFIHDIAFAKGGTCFLASECGIFKYNGTSIERLDLGKISNEAFTGIAIDNLGRIWFGHATGIICYNDGELLVYDNSDGMPTKTTSFRCLHFDSENGFWIGSAAGMIYGKMPSAFKPSSAPIFGHIENLGSLIDINGKNEFLQNSLLKIGFTSSNYPAQYVKYQYSLNRKNEVDNWKDIEYKQDYLTFDYLAEGSYTLKIRAKSKGHYRWSKPVAYQFSIYKIWYTRPEIIIGINFILLILVFLYLRYSRIKSGKEKERLEKIISLRTIDLVEQNKRLVKTQQQLIQSEKMASIGQLAAGIAHEINNPVNYVSGGIAVLRKSYGKLMGYLNVYKELFKNLDLEKTKHPQLPDDQQINLSIESSEEMFKTIEEGIDKTTKIVQSIRVFSSNSENIFTELDINETLDNILKILFNKYKDHIEIIKEYTPQSKLIGVSVNIQQIFMNLLTNAIQAIPEKGTIWIKTQQNHEQKNMIISIKDSGVGIEKEIQKKIFDPFFSTKDVGKGTGLGLYLTYTFVEQHHGSIKVISEPGKGAEFIIKLPRQITHKE